MAVKKIQQILRDHQNTLRSFTALATFIIFLTLIPVGLLTTIHKMPEGEAGNSGDLALYTRIIKHVKDGDSYYVATIDELRNGNYPLHPFVVVRLPSHALAMAALPSAEARQLALSAFAILTIAAWAWRLGCLGISLVRYALSLLALVTGIAAAFVPYAYPLHEIWAGLMISLSLALRGPDRWRASVLIGISAALVRELAAPYLVVMALMALLERNRKEAVVWFSGLIIFVVVLGIHAAKVNALVLAADPASPGWLQIGGWQFVMQTANTNLVLKTAPNWLEAVLLPFALLGFLRTDPLDRRLALTVAAYILAFVFVGRDNNFYWGFIIAPLLPLGLTTAGPALAQCLINIRQLPKAIHQIMPKTRSA